MLKPNGGRFVAFDPNRMNPFMWLYRDRASPFYSSVGVTENDCAVLAVADRRVFVTRFPRADSTTLPASPTATLLRGVRACCCQSTISSTVPCSICDHETFRPFVLTSGERAR